MHRALRTSGRARRIEPEADIVGARRRRGRIVQLVVDPIPEAQLRGRWSIRLSRDDHVLEVRESRLEGLDHRRERRRNDYHAGAAVGQQVFIVGRPEQRVARNRDNSGLDRAKKGNRKIDSVVQQQNDAIFHPHAESPPRVGAAVDPLGQVAVRISAGIVDESDMLGASRNQVALDQIDGGVVVARDVDLWRRDRVVRAGQQRALNGHGALFYRRYRAIGDKSW